MSAKIGYWPALLLAPLLVGLGGAAVERYGLRTVHKYGHVAELLYTFGIAKLSRNDPKFQQNTTGIRALLVMNTPEEFAASIASSDANWKSILQK